jgi:Reverse transcriptase (RNA-dependent DNA polymerase)
MTQILADLGFAPEIVSWCKSFLKDCTVRLQFNRRTSDPFDFAVGTPQGSLVSPVLSIIYTAPLLHKMKNLANPSLGMYIDNGAIFACRQKWKEVEHMMRDSYTSCIEWLTQASLSAELDKMELIFFRKGKEKSALPNYIHLPLPSRNTYYQVQASTTLQYLGFFLNTRLMWTHHIEVMCNRVRASIKALQLLGNSVQGLDQAKWRLAYNAICLPVLTYSCQLWFMGKQKTLVKKLQTTQNKAVKVIAGMFCTTPHKPLHQLLTILPMDIRLKMLTQNMALRLYSVSKDSQLLKWLGGDWYAPQPHNTPLPTPNSERAWTMLCMLASQVHAKCPHIQPFPDLPPDAPTWDSRVTCALRQSDWDYQLSSEALVNRCQEGKVINIFTTGVYSNKH